MSATKRVHICLVVKDIDANVTFYTRLFGEPPIILKPDYAKWRLEDPKLNFSIDAHGDKPGLDHLGIELESAERVTTALEHYRQGGIDVFGETQIVCGYHRTDKGWVTDPQAVLWETFFSPEVTPHYGSLNEEVTAEVANRERRIEDQAR